MWCCDFIILYIPHFRTGVRLAACGVGSLFLRPDPPPPCVFIFYICIVYIYIYTARTDTMYIPTVTSKGHYVLELLLYYVPCTQYYVHSSST